MDEQETNTSVESAKAPLVSIVVNNYNYGRFLREAIDSALDQTYPHTEVIVVDDGSSDDSREVIASYGKRIVPVLKENGGQASALNAGYAASRGELICLLDSDDVWLPDKVDKVVEAARAYPEANLVYHRVQPVSADRTPSGKPWPATILRGKISERVVRSGGWWNYPPTSALCFRRKFLREAMDIPETAYRISADAYLAGLAPFFGDVLGIAEALGLYRWHGSNLLNPALDPARTAEQERRKMRAHLLLYETHLNGLNEALKRMRSPYRVSFQDHWPYHRLKWKLGEGPNIFALSWAALRFPGEPSSILRLKNVAILWLEMLGLKGAVKSALENLRLRGR